MPESVQSYFELSIHFPVFFSRELFLVAVHGCFVIETNVWKCQNTSRCFVAQLCSSVIFCKILSAYSFQFINFPTRQNGVENRDKANKLWLYLIRYRNNRI